MTLRAAPDPMGVELRALDGALRRMERWGYIAPDARRESALSAAFASRASWDALRVCALASRAAARVCNVSAHEESAQTRAIDAGYAHTLLLAVAALAVAAERRAWERR